MIYVDKAKISQQNEKPEFKYKHFLNLEKGYDFRFFKLGRDITFHSTSSFTVKAGSYIRIEGMYYNSLDKRIHIDIQSRNGDNELQDETYFIRTGNCTPDEIETLMGETFISDDRTEKAKQAYYYARVDKDKQDDKSFKALFAVHIISFIMVMMSLVIFLMSQDNTFNGQLYASELPNWLAKPSFTTFIGMMIFCVLGGIWEHFIKKGVYTDSWIDRYDKEYWERDRKKHRHFEKLTGRDVDKLTEKDMIIEYLKLLETNASEQEIGDFNAFEKLFGVKKKEKHKTPEKKNKTIKQPKPESVKEVREEPVKQEKQADAFPEERAVETNGGNDADLFNGIWESYPMGLELFRTIKDKDVLDYMDDEKKGA